MGLKTRRSLPGLGVVRSAAVSMRHVLERKKTVQYPDEAPAVGFRFRGRHIFHQDVCIGCTQCERVCPVIAIKMETHKDPTSRKVVTDRFALDLGICYYCGLCEEVCPTDPKAVHMGPDFELATHDRRLLIYEMDQLVGPKPLPTKPKPVPAAVPAAAPAPGGAAPPAAAAAGEKPAAPPSAEAEGEKPAAHPPAAPEAEKPAAAKPTGEVQAVPQAPASPAPPPHVVPVAKPDIVADAPAAASPPAPAEPAAAPKTDAEPPSGLPDQPVGQPPIAPAETVKLAIEPEIVSDEPKPDEPGTERQPDS
jgi:NADH-quinone oxidoreductase chain I